MPAGIKRDATLTGKTNECFHLIDRDARRLFKEHMLASFERLHGRVKPDLRWLAEDDGIECWFARQH